MERFLTQEAVDERSLAFLEALALGREPPLRPTIQDLERYAPQWAFLVPDNPKIRAALAHILGKKYRFTREDVVGIRAALGLDGDEVQRTYRQMYGKPMDTVFATRSRATDSIRWAWTRLGNRVDSLPPFWTAFALTLTETAATGYLALPIALAGIGPLAGVAILLVLGVANVLTIAFLSEAVTRNGSIRYGSAFIGRLARDYLGRLGSFVLAVSLFAICWLGLIAYYIGFGVTLAHATEIHAELWIGLVFVVSVYLGIQIFWRHCGFCNCSWCDQRYFDSNPLSTCIRPPATRKSTLCESAPLEWPHVRSFSLVRDLWRCLVLLFRSHLVG
jgi:hypothetical protein